MIVFDVALIVVLHRKMKQKREIQAKLGQTQSRSTLNAKENETRITAQIVINCFILIFFKFVHLTFSFYVLINKLSIYMTKNVCLQQSRICSNLKEISDVLYSISNIYNIVLFYTLNNNFRRIFKQIFCRSNPNFSSNQIQISAS